MRSLLVFTKNFFDVSGGAERSIASQIEESMRDYSSINIMAVQSNKPRWYKSGSVIEHELKINKGFGSLFPYFDYWMNKKRIRRWVQRIIYENPQIDVWTQNIWAPMLAGLPVRVYLRDETGLGLRPNYRSGWTRVLANMLHIIEYPFLYLYKSDQKKLYEHCSEVIANSKWMAEEFEKKYKKRCKVIYPQIDIEELKVLYNKGEKASDQVVLIGGELVKGINTFVELATLFPQWAFTIYSKVKVKRKLPKNLIVKPWCEDRSEPFRSARVVIVPSLWNEAFGRVAAESVALGIPVLVSDKGGLPEAVRYDKSLIARDLNEFKEKLEGLLLCAE